LTIPSIHKTTNTDNCHDSLNYDIAMTAMKVSRSLCLFGFRIQRKIYKQENSLYPFEGISNLNKIASFVVEHGQS